MGVKSLSQWCIVLVNAHNAVCASLSSRGDTASIAPVLSVDVLVVPPTCWILSAGFAPMHKTAGYLPFLCLFFIYGANWQIAHYSHASAALYLLQWWSLCVLLLMSIWLGDVGYEMDLHRKPCTDIHKKCGSTDLLLFPYSTCWFSAILLAHPWTQNILILVSNVQLSYSIIRVGIDLLLIC